MERITQDKGKLATEQLNLQPQLGRKISEPPKIPPQQSAETLKEKILEAYERIIGQKPLKSDEISKNAKAVAEWLTKDAKTRPWLKIAGYVGNGKTTMVQAFRLVYEASNWPRLFPIVTADSLAKMAARKPEEYERLIALPRLIIDDIGTEPGEVSVYGNKIQPVTEMFFARYMRKAATIYTTNLTAEQFREQYGERIEDRCEQLQKKIVFTQKESFRRMQ